MMNLSAQETDLGHYDVGLHWARRAFRLDPNWGNSYYHVGYPLVVLGDDAATERWLAEGEQRFPDTMRVQILLAMLDCLRGREREAGERVRKAKTASPNDEEVLLMSADLALITRATDAEILLERFYKSAPDLSGGFWMLPETFRVKYAFVLARHGEMRRATHLIQEAEKLARQALDKGNEFPRARIEMAAIQTFEGHKESALDWLLKAYDAGWRDSRTLSKDPMIEELRGSPKFEALSDRINKDVAAMRGRSADLRELFTASAPANIAPR
jgi:tetratricopeptide (TPR) repeat protein